MSLLPHHVVWLHGTTVPISGVVGPMSLLYKCLASVIRLYVTTACANICHYSVSCWENEIVLEHCIEALQGKMTFLGHHCT